MDARIEGTSGNRGDETVIDIAEVAKKVRIPKKSPIWVHKNILTELGMKK